MQRKKTSFNKKASPFGPLERKMWDCFINGDKKGIISAIHQGASVDAIRPGLPAAHRRTLLEDYLSRDLKFAKQLLDLGANINRPDYQGDTPLFGALITREKKLIDFLIENGADINHRNKKGQTAIMRAYNLMSTNKKEYTDIWKYLAKKLEEKTGVHDPSPGNPNRL